MQRRNKTDWARMVTTGLEMPTVITNEWIDQILSSDKADMFMRWGFCHRDLSEHDLSRITKEYFPKLTFNSSTIFPNADKMPKGFSPSEIIERGKDPMLGIKELHKKGIDGSGVTVATIDFGFQSENHSEYKGSNIQVVDLFGDTGFHFHSDGILSNLCGQNIGVAPKANVIHYSIYQGIGDNVQSAQIQILQDILKRVKGGERIRAVNISGPIVRSSILNDLKNDSEKYEAAKSELMKPLTPILYELQKLGCEVIDSERFGQDFTCCDVDTANNKSDYKKPDWFDDEKAYGEKVSFVCGGKVIPEYTCNNGYKYENDSCYSWTIPQAVGMYALALQQKPNLTWDQFARISKNTSIITKDGIRLAQPQSIILFLQGE